MMMIELNREAIEKVRIMGNNSNQNNEVSIQSSAAEYLTFITSSGKGGVEAIYADENVWLTQKMLGNYTIFQKLLLVNI